MRNYAASGSKHADGDASLSSLRLNRVRSAIQPCWVVGLALLSAAVMSGRSRADDVDFNRDIRPIISEKCVHCHGPDGEHRKADLRLDTEEGSRADLGGYTSVVPGNPDDSELIYRVFTDDEDELMPPPKSNRELSQKEKDLLRLWVEQGGDYDEHWAFVAPTKPSEVVEDDIDSLIDRKLKKAGLEPSIQADRRTLIRRVSFDMIGLPPTPDEIRAFEADESMDAYEKLVDRLLASKRFGERWARPWLDLARYADSNGFQADQLRDSWAYRDWVIASFNDGKPFDEFTIEQIAGDLLPDATLDQRIATGFNRTVTCNVEAGVHPEENRVNQVIDRVNATATTWLGMTIECSQCHDHKFDPVTQKEYFELYSIFNNTPLEVENKSGKGVQFTFWGPKMELPLESSKAKHRSALHAQLEDLIAGKRKLVTTISRSDWEKELLAAMENPPQWQVLEIADASSNGGEDIKVLGDQSVLFTGNLPGTAVYEIVAETSLENIIGFKLEALTHPDLLGDGPGRGDGKRSNFILSEFGVEARSPGSQTERSLRLHSAEADFSQTNWDVEKAIDGDSRTGWAIGPEFGKSHWASFLTETSVGSKEGQTLKFTIDQNFGRGRTLGRVRLSALIGDASALDVPQDVTEAIQKPKKNRSSEELASIKAFMLKSNPEIRQIELEIRKVTRLLDETEPPTTLVMVEMDEPRETHLMRRGSYLSPGEKVEPGTPAALHAWDPDLPRNRLGFAKWIVDENNPITARVTVNRWWTELFGHGIVQTLEDFGTQSTPPTHPELLDWLAVEFVESGWSMKHMLKLMVLSDAYRRDSNFSPELLEADPENKLYARGPRFRMAAEMIRDNALAVSGLLSTEMEGPPIMPYQPGGLWKQTGRNEPKWVTATDENRYRRGIYVVWRRAAPYPSFVNFDAPDRTSCTVKRGRTNTPLQALTLLNDPAYVEMALALAVRVLQENPDASSEAKIERAFEIVLARRPDVHESARLHSLFEERRFHLESHPEEAADIVEKHDFPLAVPDALPTAELVAWFYIANVLLNLDETITKG